MFKYTDEKLKIISIIMRVLSFISGLASIFGLIVCVFNSGFTDSKNIINTEIGLLIFIGGLSSGIVTMFISIFFRGISEMLSNSYDILVRIESLEKNLKK